MAATDTDLMRAELDAIETYLALPPEQHTWENAPRASAEAHAALIRTVLRLATEKESTPCS